MDMALVITQVDARYSSRALSSIRSPQSNYPTNTESGIVSSRSIQSWIQERHPESDSEQVQTKRIVIESKENYDDESRRIDCMSKISFLKKKPREAAIPRFQFITRQLFPEQCPIVLGYIHNSHIMYILTSAGNAELILQFISQPSILSRFPNVLRPNPKTNYFPLHDLFEYADPAVIFSIFSIPSVQKKLPLYLKIENKKKETPLHLLLGNAGGEAITTVLNVNSIASVLYGLLKKRTDIGEQADTPLHLLFKNNRAENTTDILNMPTARRVIRLLIQVESGFNVYLLRYLFKRSDVNTIVSTLNLRILQKSLPSILSTELYFGVNKNFIHRLFENPNPEAITTVLTYNAVQPFLLSLLQMTNEIGETPFDVLFRVADTNVINAVTNIPGVKMALITYLKLIIIEDDFTLLHSILMKANSYAITFVLQHPIIQDVLPA